MKRSSTVALLLAALFLPACGEDSATDPSTVAVTTSTLTFTSTVTGLPVVGASVVVGGSAYTSAADGTVALSTPAIIGTTIDATAPGFLTRLTTFKSESAITLWQIPAGASENFVRQLAYNRPGSPELLWRPNAASLTIQLSGDLANDPQVRAAHLQAATMATAMTGGRVTVLLGGSTTTAGVFTMLLNSANPGTATTFLTQTRGNIVGGRIEYSNLAAARTPSIVAHEFGHLLGFGHAPSGLMCPSACGVETFSPLEQEVFISMWQRLAGTAPPDNDRVVTSSSDAGVTAIRCDLR